MPVDPDHSPRFPATRWSIVVRAAEGSETERDDALSELCRAYWFPVYAFIRRGGASPHDAEDLTQGFFAMFLRRGDFYRADPERGRLRTLLLSALQNFLRDEHRRTHRLKRWSPAVVPISADAEERFLRVADSGRAADAHFERQWAQHVLGRAMQRLEEAQPAERQGHVPALRKALSGQADPGFYDEAALSLGQTAASLRVLVHRLRKQLRSFIEEEIRETVASDSEFQSELLAFRAALTA